MAYRHVMITQPYRLSIKNSQLVLESEERFTVPLEDILTILIESPQVTVSSALLARLGEEGILCYLCDRKHLPSTILLPFHGHSRQLKILQAQIGLKPVLKKHLWQQVVIQKVQNQAEVLRLAGFPEWKEIWDLSLRVKSNDSDHLEAVAAAKYFPILFGKGFTRGQDSLTNARLNYGYALVRGLICRHLVVYGFEPALGIYHLNQLNAFNLADDLMEVFRPMVDLLVFGMEQRGEDEGLSRQDKIDCYHLFNMDIQMDHQHHSLGYAAERFIQSFQNSVVNGKLDLKNCKVIPLQQHEYE